MFGTYAAASATAWQFELRKRADKDSAPTVTAAANPYFCKLSARLIVRNCKKIVSLASLKLTN
jgi:hypothetical protein